MNVLLQSFQRKSKSFCFVKSLDIFEIVPPVVLVKWSELEKQFGAGYWLPEYSNSSLISQISNQNSSKREMRTSQDQIPLAIFWIANSVFLVGWCYFAHWTPCHLYFTIHCSISHKQVIQVASGRTLAWRLAWWIRRVC